MLYVLIAVGFSMIYGIMRVVNFAHGQLYMLGAIFVCTLMGKLGLSFIPSLLVSTISVGVLGTILEKTLFSKLRANEFAAVISSVGVGIFLQGIVEAIIGGESWGVESPWGGVVKISGVFLAGDRLVVLGFALATVSVFYLFLKFTKFGRATRATVDDAEISTAFGIKVPVIYTINFGLAAMLAAIAGGLIAPLTGASATMGLPAMLKAFIVVILGGLGSISGVVVGGLVLGIVESVITTLISSEASELISFLMILLVLIFKPRGLLGK